MGRPRKNPPGEGAAGAIPITVGDVADIVYPSGVPKNPDGSVQLDGELSVDEAQEAGALSEESAAKNRAFERTIVRKAKGETRVKWNSRAYQDLFTGIKMTFNPALITLFISQLTPDDFDYPAVKMSQFRTPEDLYQHILRNIHRRSPPAKYRVIFKEGVSDRGTCEISMMDTTTGIPDKANQAEDTEMKNPQQPASPYPGYVWNGMQWVPQQAYAAPYQPPPAQPPPAPPAPEQQHMAPPPPNQPGQDTNAYMHWLNAQHQELRAEQRQNAQMHQMQMERLLAAFENLRTQQPAPAPVQAPVVAPPQQPVYPPPGYLGGAPPPYGYPQPHHPPPPPAPVAAPPPPPAPPNPLQQMRDAANTMTGVMGVMGEMNNIFKKMNPTQAAPQSEEEYEEVPAQQQQDELPVKIVPMGIGDKQVPVAMDPAGNIQWGMTLVPMIPTMFEGMKSAMEGMSKFQDRQHQHEMNLFKKKTELASAQRGGTLPAPPVTEVVPEPEPPPPPPEPVPPPVDTSAIWRT